MIDEEHPDWIKYITKIAREASIKARKEALATGIPVLFMGEDGKLYEEYKNGKIKLFKK